MSLNYSFMVDQVESFAGSNTVLLDYGCGCGELINEAIDRGHEAYGCDSYLNNWNMWAGTASSHKRVCLIEDSQTVPFPDGHFDVVTANQVFEHIEDFRKPLSEIYRVLRPGGIFINCFPTMDIWWEGHIKAPFAHRFFSSRQLFRKYIAFAHMFRLGTHARKHDRQTFIANWDSLPEACFYKSARDVEGLFLKHFDIIRRAEPEWIRHRLVHHPRLRTINPPNYLDPLLRFACIRLAGCVFVMRKRLPVMS